MSLCHDGQRGRVEQAAADLENVDRCIATDKLGPDEGNRSGWTLEVTLVDVDGLPPEVAKVLADRQLTTPVSQRRGAGWTVVATV